MLDDELPPSTGAPGIGAYSFSRSCPDAGRVVVL